MCGMQQVTQGDNLKSSLCRVVVPCGFKNITVSVVMQSVHVNTIHMKAGFLHFPRGVASAAPGYGISHLCAVGDLIWNGAAGSWLKEP